MILLSSGGSWFHNLGAAAAKALSPRVDRAFTAGGDKRWSQQVVTIYTLLILFPFFFNDLHVFILCPQISMGMEQEAKRLVSTPTIYIPISKKVASLMHVS